MSWLLDAEPAPAILVLPPGDVDLDEAHAAIEQWEFYSGKTLDPAQRLAVEVMMAQTADGLWAAATTGREMPRQNGKGEEIEVVEFWGITQRGERILHTIHDAVLLSTETQDRMLALFQHPDLRDRLERGQVWRGTGQQMIKVADRVDDDGNVISRGGTIWYRTRTKGGARGVDHVDRVVIDEAQHATEQHINAVVPTMQASPNAQLNALGTAGLPEESHWWWDMRVRALKHVKINTTRFGYVGHTAEKVYLDGERVVQEPVDVTNRKLWFQANPSLCAGRGGGLPFFEAELEDMRPAGFAQEQLCVWAPYPGQDGGFLPAEKWRNLAVADPKLSSVCYGLSVSLDGETGSIGSAGHLPDGRSYIDNVLDDLNIDEDNPSTDEIVTAAVDLWKRKKIPFRVNGAAVEGSLIRRLTNKGVEVVEVPGRLYQQTCGEVLDGIKNGVLHHLDQEPLNRAVRAVQRREVGKEGGWVWAEPLSGVDVSPLKAATLALSGVEQPRKPKIHVYDPDYRKEA